MQSESASQSFGRRRPIFAPRVQQIASIPQIAGPSIGDSTGQLSGVQSQISADPPCRGAVDAGPCLPGRTSHQTATCVQLTNEQGRSAAEDCIRDSPSAEDPARQAGPTKHSPFRQKGFL